MGSSPTALDEGEPGNQRYRRTDQRPRCLTIVLVLAPLFIAAGRRLWRTLEATPAHR